MTLRLIDQPAWMAHARCRGMDPDLFHPERGDAATVRAAKACCARCPVQEACLDYALSLPTHAVLGIWGGTSERQRRRIRQTRRRRAA